MLSVDSELATLPLTLVDRLHTIGHVLFGDQKEKHIMAARGAYENIMAPFIGQLEFFLEPCRPWAWALLTSGQE